MVPLYAARLEDLGPGNLVQLECAGGRTAVFTPAMLRTTGVEPAERVVGLESRFHCRECDAGERRRCRSNGNGKSSALIRGREIAAGAVNRASFKARFGLVRALGV
jgi:hypothetical protein